MHEIFPKVLRKSFKNVTFFGNVVIYGLLSHFWKYHDLRTLGNIFGSIFLTGNILALFSALGFWTALTLKAIELTHPLSLQTLEPV